MPRFKTQIWLIWYCGHNLVTEKKCVHTHFCEEIIFDSVLSINLYTGNTIHQNIKYFQGVLYYATVPIITNDVWKILIFTISLV